MSWAKWVGIIINQNLGCFIPDASQLTWPIFVYTESMDKDWGNPKTACKVFYIIYYIIRLESMGYCYQHQVETPGES